MATVTRRVLIPVLVALALLAMLATPAMSSEGEATAGPFYGTALSLLPPVIAIGLALITKEVYSSLFIGILSGALLTANFNPFNSVVAISDMLTGKVADQWNAGILIFLVLLGALVSLMNTAGGSAAYGKWASRKINSKRGALLSTFGLGVLIFVDDYFNCLTVGSVMTPVTDKQKISRAKLAYLIDATAAPVCIIAPISSWAAAVTSSVNSDAIDGFDVFLRAIPYNLYALLTMAMVIIISALGFDFGPMKRQEHIAHTTGNLFGGGKNEYVSASEQAEPSPRGRAFDLILPVLVLIGCCIFGMVYTGGILDGVGFIAAFRDCDASRGLAIGSIIALLFTFVLYVPRGVVSFRQFAGSLPEGFRQMIPAILILTFAWTLSGFCKDGLGAGAFVGGLVESGAAVSAFLPALMFAVALGLAFATGTSWGTFGILLPICLPIFPEMSELLIITISAVLAGAVCGDHISPISDTTIMSSTGAQCNHIAHVSTQIPYAMVVAGVSFIGYIIAGYVQNAAIALSVSGVLLVLILLIIRAFSNKTAGEAIE
ncbi:MAG: Na+/H+ antiporter NhaC family protein [Oscillospiraceae bacterium]|jgi:Na+/H+ antiporter NhaC|nr:Na+/H+ antiporter NhaC family protein [Oscillospiraceae bacterium]